MADQEVNMSQSSLAQETLVTAASNLEEESDKNKETFDLNDPSLTNSGEELINDEQQP